MGLNVGAVVAGATCRQLERLNGEGEILVIGVVDQEPVVERFLDAAGIVAGGNKRARRSRG